MTKSAFGIGAVYRQATWKWYWEVCPMPTPLVGFYVRITADHEGEHPNYQSWERLPDLMQRFNELDMKYDGYRAVWLVKAVR